MWQQDQSVGGKNRQAFIKQAALEREKRQKAREEKVQLEIECNAVVVLQRFARRVINEARAKEKAANELDKLIGSTPVQGNGTVSGKVTKNSADDSTVAVETDASVAAQNPQPVKDLSAKDLYGAIDTHLKMVEERNARRQKTNNFSAEDKSEKHRLHVLLRCVLKSMETSQPANQQYLGVATSNRVGWIAQVIDLLGTVLTRLSTIRESTKQDTSGSVGKIQTTSQPDLAAVESGVGSVQPQTNESTTTKAQEESLYLHALVILTDARSWHIVKSTPKLGALAAVFQTLSRAVVTGLVEKHRYYTHLGRYMRSVAADKARKNQFMPGNTAGVPVVTIVAMVTLALRPLSDQCVGSTPGQQTNTDASESRCLEYVWHCLSVPCLVELVDKCRKHVWPIPFEDSLQLVIRVLGDREIAAKFARMKKDEGLRAIDSKPQLPTHQSGESVDRTDSIQGGKTSGPSGAKSDDVNRLLALYGNTVVLGARWFATHQKLAHDTTKVRSSSSTTTTPSSSSNNQSTNVHPSATSLYDKVGDRAHTSEQYIQCLYTLTKVCLSEIAASKERARTTSSATSALHPILGMTSIRTSKEVKHLLPDIHTQIKGVWDSRHLEAVLMQDLGRCVEDKAASTQADRRPSGGSVTRIEGGKLIRRASSRRSKENNHSKSQDSSTSAEDRREKGGRIVDLNAALRVCKACQLLYILPRVFPNDKNMLWNRVNCMPGALSGLYRLLLSVGPSGGMAVFLTAASNSPSSEVMLPILLLFCDCCTNLLVTLDDTDMYEEQKSLTLLDFRFLVRFLIRFIYNLLIVGRKRNRLDKSYKTSLGSAHALLRALRDRDSARNFTQESDWRLPVQILSMRQIDEILDTVAVGTPAHSKADTATVEAYNQLILYMPHLIPFKRRVRLFRGYVEQDRPITPTNVPAREITVRRGRVLEDGFTQLRNFSTVEFKQTFRVRFVNELGQDEVGIDQHGVFKEFLEDVIVAAFDAELGLFVSTADNRLYPSVLSAVQPEHLQLFYFVGRMLGKAVYEGVIEDVLLAHFFLNKILGRYNFRNELPSLDAELDKSLRFVKSYKGDLEDLCLTFSSDEDVFGETVTTDLVPGGSAMAVTNDNAILYIYLMADHRMNKAIEHQSKAFVKGFTEVIHRNWLRLFSATDIQTLIAGDGAGGVDVNNLMENTQYGGGYSAGHRTVRNLWSVVKDDLTPDQQRLFLKFVTSCSRPPALGFQTLQPPFTVILQPNDGGDARETRPVLNMLTFGLVGTIDTTRLPTSSTCFNCLKLPPYKTRNNLKDRLLYAISAKAGFELA